MRTFAFLAAFGAGFALAAGAVAPFPAHAADPARITIIVPYPAGGLSDTLARLTGKVLGQNLSIPVIVENKPGANGVLGLTAVANATPDGSTIGMVPASVMTVNPSLYKDMKVDTVRDITALTLAITLPNVLVVNPSVPATNMAELVEWLKKSPNVTYGSMGMGSSAHLNGELLLRSAGLTMNHVPYKGSAPAMQDLIAGNIQMAFENLPVALPHIQSGRLRAIGVTSTEASPQVPEIPPIGKAIPGFEDNIWFGFIAPAGLPADVADRLNRELVRAIESEEVAGPMKSRGATITTSSRERMQAVVIADRDKWKKLVSERKIEVQ